MVKLNTRPLYNHRSGDLVEAVTGSCKWGGTLADFNCAALITVSEISHKRISQTRCEIEDVNEELLGQSYEQAWRLHVGLFLHRALLG